MAVRRRASFGCSKQNHGRRPPHPPRRHRPGARTIFRRRRHEFIFTGVRRRPEETSSAVSSPGSFNPSKNQLRGEKLRKFPWGVVGRADRAAAAITPAAARNSVAGPKNFFSLFDPADVRRSNPTYHVPSIHISSATDCGGPRTTFLKIFEKIGE